MALRGNCGLSIVFTSTKKYTSSIYFRYKNHNHWMVSKMNANHCFRHTVAKRISIELQKTKETHLNHSTMGFLVIDFMRTVKNNLYTNKFVVKKTFEKYPHNYPFSFVTFVFYPRKFIQQYAVLYQKSVQIFMFKKYWIYLEPRYKKLSAKNLLSWKCYIWQR